MLDRPPSWPSLHRRCCPSLRRECHTEAACSCVRRATPSRVPTPSPEGRSRSILAEAPPLRCDCRSPQPLPQDSHVPSRTLHEALQYPSFSCATFSSCPYVGRTETNNWPPCTSAPCAQDISSIVPSI